MACARFATVTGEAPDPPTANTEFYDSRRRKSRLLGPDCFNT